jgi:hypothetical protein
LHEDLAFILPVLDASNLNGDKGGNDNSDRCGKYDFDCWITVRLFSTSMKFFSFKVWVRAPLSKSSKKKRSDESSQSFPRITVVKRYVTMVAFNVEPASPQEERRALQFSTFIHFHREISSLFL